MKKLYVSPRILLFRMEAQQMVCASTDSEQHTMSLFGSSQSSGQEQQEEIGSEDDFL